MRDPLEGVDADGTIVTGAARRRVPTTFEPVLAAAVDAVADPSVSVHVYGSVATGTARVGASDVDLLAVGLPSVAAAALQEALSERFGHLARAVEIAVAQPEDFTGAGDEAYGGRVFLKHYCVRLAGPDLQAALPRAAADARAARGFNGDIARHYRTWVAAVQGDRSGWSLDAAALGRRVARKTLLALAGLVSVHDTTWTTDRISAAHRWSQLRPACAPDVNTLVQWSEGTGVASLSQCHRILAAGGGVAGVVEDFRTHIGLWDEAVPSHL